MKRLCAILTAMALLSVIAGCSPEPRTITIHEPGVYKGQRDPVMELKNQQELNDRFRLVQTDR